MKRYFIRKSPSDLIQEQNKLIEKFISKPSDPEQIIVREILKDQKQDYDYNYNQQDSFNEVDEIEEEIPFIPFHKHGEANLPSLNIQKKELNEDSVEKLKKIMKGD